MNNKIAEQNNTGEGIAPRVYVGTYGKYNSGSIAGKWLDLEDYADKEDFLKACAELHKGEHDPEFMFQDYEGIPQGMVSESHIDDELWEWIALDGDDRELVTVYQKNVDESGTIEQAREAFGGRYKDEADWAYEFLRDTGGLDGMPEHLQNYFDYEAYARDAGYNGMSFVKHEGETWVFNS
jgi:antirestriction protein